MRVFRLSLISGHPLGWGFAIDVSVMGVNWVTFPASGIPRLRPRAPGWPQRVLWMTESELAWALAVPAPTETPTLPFS